MTLKIHEKSTNNGKYKAIVDWEKGNTFSLLVFRDKGQNVVENYDIIIDKRYFSEKSAVSAMHRAIRNLNRE